MDAGLLQKNYEYLSKLRATDRKMKFKGQLCDFSITASEKEEEKANDMVIAKKLTLDNMLARNDNVHDKSVDLSSQEQLERITERMRSRERLSSMMGHQKSISL